MISATVLSIALTMVALFTGAKLFPQPQRRPIPVRVRDTDRRS